jgi:hypothetical protein
LALGVDSGPSEKSQLRRVRCGTQYGLSVFPIQLSVTSSHLPSHTAAAIASTDDIHTEGNGVPWRQGGGPTARPRDERGLSSRMPKSRAREPAASMRTVTLRARAVKLAEGAPGERRPPDDCLRSEAQTPSEPLRPCHAVHRLRLCELPLPLIRLEELRPLHRLLHRRGASFLSAVLTLGSSVWHGSASPSSSPCRRLRRLHQSVPSEASMATRLVSQQARAAMLRASPSRWQRTFSGSRGELGRPRCGLCAPRDD